MRITVAQVDCRLGDIDGNLQRVEQVLAEAPRSDIVVFPELNLTGYSIGDVEVDLAMEADDDRLLRLARQAGSAGLVLGFVESPADSVHQYNSAGYYEDGRPLHVHRKLYLPTYSIFEERKVFSPGQTMRAFTSRAGGRMAILTCNDAWQPQLAFVAVQDGARVLLVPTASAQSLFPERYDSRGYWRGITRFYARMFQTFVVFANRVGSEGKLQFWGGSHVVDPWGEVIAEATTGTEDLLTVDVDLGAVRRRRTEVPLIKEARLGLLNREIERLIAAGGDM
ncbi:MAG TPA: nitrilase-related carbon-nitrogen hydrolase [Euzebyales bacterium]|nr:nitrilase-related carbon-nitrogen hydrolase [Euzebyales bacterium]